MAENIYTKIPDYTARRTFFSLAMKIFPRTLRDAADALAVIAAAKATALKLISPAEAMPTPPIIGRRVRYTGHGIRDPVSTENTDVNNGSAPFTICAVNVQGIAGEGRGGTYYSRPGRKTSAV